jgi:hypothetical protein
MTCVRDCALALSLVCVALHSLTSVLLGKWAYALIEYDLAYEPLKSRRGQVVADFIVEHRINDTHKLDMSYITITPWTLYFDGSICNEGQVMSPSTSLAD